MNEKEILSAFLGATLNLQSDKLAEILYKKADDGSVTDQLNEGILDTLKKLDTERVGKLKPDTKQFFDNGYKKAQAEIATNWEKLIREKTGVDPEGKLQGEALVDAVKAASASQSADPDKVKTSAEYLELERRMRAELGTLKETYEKQIAEIQTGYEKQQIWAKASGRIREIAREKFDLPADQAKADALLDLFLHRFSDLEFQPDTSEGFIPIKGGKRLENQHGHARALAEVVEEYGKTVFDPKKSGGGNAGNQNNGGRSANMKFKDENDYLKQYSEAPTPEAKAALYQAWQAQTAEN